MRLSMQKKLYGKTALEAKKEFIEYKVNENLSSDSVKSYEEMIGIFLAFYGEGKPCASIDFDVVEKYKAHLRTKPKKEK